MSSTAPRRFDSAGGWRMDRRTFEVAVDLLAVAITAGSGPGEEPPVVVGIGGGGREPAARLSNQLGLGYKLVHARHNPTDASYTQATGRVHVDVTELAAELGGRQIEGQVLLVDDICGSGATLTAVTAALAPHLQPGTALTGVALCRNTGAVTDLLDYWIFDVSDWVYFPWEAQAGATDARPLPHPARVLTK